MKTVAVIQPYFVPYAGYYRLFEAADYVVMFDCVQFPRRGWVHRNRFFLSTGELDWLTLPIAKADRDARIDRLRFPEDAVARLEAALRRFPLLQNARTARHSAVEAILDIRDADVTPYLIRLIQGTTNALGMERPVIRSSTLNIDRELRAQERVLAIVTALGGTHYVNPSGGRELYDHETFSKAGVTLRFLSPYEGPMASILARVIEEPVSEIAAEIKAQTILLP